jgi:PKD repeat protein
MKKISLVAALFGGLFFGSGFLFAQHVHHPGCGTHLDKAMQDEHFAADMALFNEYVKDYIRNGGETERSGDVRIMPVVVHVIHTGGSSNVSDATVNSMITKMNQAYSKSAPNINTLPLRFDTIAGDPQIEFRLAKKDPLGNCTNGIRRVYAPHKSRDAYDDKRFKSLSYWDRAKYLNIWITNNIKDPSDDGSGQILGYCLFPGSAPALRDGATIAFGAMTTNAVAGHEIGHHLNLIHVWGDAVCGDDQVDDTPIARGVNFAWANPCDTLVKEATCYENIIDNYRDSLLRYGIGENYQNYMDYVNNYNCPNMFTEGQIERMNAVFQFYSFRGNVVSEANNIATGVNDGAAPCTELAPVAEFWATNPVTCVNTPVSFVNGSFNGAATTFSWTFEGGTPSTSTEEDPDVVYAAPGVYNVTLTVSNGAGSSTKTKTGVVFIMDDLAESKPWGYFEGFEEGQYWDQGRWTVTTDQTDAGKNWKFASGVSYSGNYCIKMDNFQNTRDNNSSLISPPFDLDAIEGGSKQFRFKLAYALRTAEEFAFDESSQQFVPVVRDRLVLSRSSNCGTTWSTVKTFTETELLSAGLSPDAFTPDATNLWKELTVNLTSANATGNNVRFRFEFTSGSSVNNNLYIDDIQILATSGANASIEEMTAGQIDFEVYPNPVTAQSVVSFNLPESVNSAFVEVFDLTGRRIAQVYSGQLDAGLQTFPIQREMLGTSGVYFVKVTLNGKTFVEKVIAQ